MRSSFCAVDARANSLVSRRRSPSTAANTPFILSAVCRHPRQCRRPGALRGRAKQQRRWRRRQARAKAELLGHGWRGAAPLLPAALPSWVPADPQAMAQAGAARSRVGGTHLLPARAPDSACAGTSLPSQQPIAAQCAAEAPSNPTGVAGALLRLRARNAQAPNDHVIREFRCSIVPRCRHVGLVAAAAAAPPCGGHVPRPIPRVLPPPRSHLQCSEGNDT